MNISDENYEEVENLPPDEEIRRIFEMAEKLSSQQQIVFSEVEEEFKDWEDQAIQNPDESHRLYHKTIAKLLRENFYSLLSSKENSSKRQLIYDQKNLLLNVGKEKNENGIRNSDGKMATTATMKMVMEIIADWVATDGRSTFNLFAKLRDKNIELGYLDPKNPNQ